MTPDLKAREIAAKDWQIVKIQGGVEIVGPAIGKLTVEQTHCNVVRIVDEGLLDEFGEEVPRG